MKTTMPWCNARIAHMVQVAEYELQVSGNQSCGLHSRLSPRKIAASASCDKEPRNVRQEAEVQLLVRCPESVICSPWQQI